MQLVHDFLEQSAARLPDKVALVCEGQRLTYAQIDAMANRLAHGLLDHGVRRGDRVVLFLPNSVELVVGIFAALKANAVFVVINASTKEDKLRYMLHNCRAAALITGANQAPLAAALMAEVPSLGVTVLTGGESAGPGMLAFDAIQADYPATRPPRRCIDQDLACLIYTSGSTGDPKGVMSAHSNVVFAASSIITYLQNVEEDVVINVLPLSFDYGLYQLLMTFKFGGRLVLERSFAYPAQVLKQMEAEAVTGLPGVPTLFAMLLQMDLSPYDLRSLRYITNTAAALPVSHIAAIREKFPWATLYSMYGLTETKRTLYLPPEQLDIRPDSVGIPIPGTEVWIEDEEGNRLGPNQVGELVIRGGHVMRGYWENPEATAARYRPGPLPGERVCYSGDLFRMDEEGYFYFVGRKDDIIKSRGEKVAPKEIENVLYKLPGVVEAAVIGVEDPVLGQAIKAFVVCRETPGNGRLTERDVLRHCRAHLEDYMMPKYVEFCDELPKTSSGKIKKTGLA
ncbi:AMP-binding protein [Litorilinea aerophila]|uniref:AMP-binding protein n=1 Tax=Litorilinea aerophila TaxID=1204385 RepID=A0A540VH82_9CHLR|nr:AMP-binding protein [Litorilinea aerophila]MCC9076790.1 AMP-binding protein [Litorilinea aerophila]GIV76521.1 MAG: AMP-dependent ligase [Litorilinea sp.]